MTPQSAGERTAQILSAVLVAVATVAAVLVFVLTDSDVSHHTDLGGGLTGGGGPTGTAQGADGSTSASGSDSSSSSSSSSSSTSGGSGSFDIAAFKAHFPLPTGAVRSAGSGTPDTRSYRVLSSLAPIKAFYLRELRARGVDWSTFSTVETGTTTVTGWHGTMRHPQAARMGAFLSLDHNDDGGAPGTVTIAVMIAQY